MMNALGRYLKQNKRSCGSLARELNVAPSQISRLVAGTRGPSVTLAVEIERATAGAVPVSTWSSHRRQSNDAPARRSTSTPRRVA